MCGRTSLYATPEELSGRFDVSVPDSYRPRYNVAPSDDLAVVRSDERDRLRLHRWGLVPDWTEEGHEGFINARAETVEDKRSFREAAAERRCLVLADGFYEWEDRKTGTQPYRVERADGGPFAMAGLYEPREDGPTTVAVVTTEPNAVVEPLHHRMAVVLDRDDEQAWLDAGASDERASLLDTPSPAGWESYPVSDRVGDPRAEGPDLVEPLEGADEDPQTGLDDFA
jgi:putative SOS response-associated peptidase YedK